MSKKGKNYQNREKLNITFGVGLLLKTRIISFIYISISLETIQLTFYFKIFVLKLKSKKTEADCREKKKKN